METETLTVKAEGTTLSALLARHYRAVFAGMAGAAYALNQDLAREGATLPVGQVVTVPTRAAFEASQAVGQPVVDLFA